VTAHPTVHWTEGGKACCARWRSESGVPPARRVVIADDHMTADDAYGLACQGTALLWRGDFQNARQMLLALASRADRQPRRRKKSAASSMPASPAEAFHLYRQARSQRARTLGALLVPLDEDYGIPLRRAPDIRQACAEAYGPGEGPSVTSLRALLGLIGAHEWRTKGIEIAAIGDRIHPHYGVFAPIRGEYVDLVATAPLPALSSSSSLAFDIGTGTGVLAAVLARRGIMRVVATDRDPRALACARENLERLGLAQQVEVVQADLFPEGRAALVVCNPPYRRPNTGRISPNKEKQIARHECEGTLGDFIAAGAYLLPAKSRMAVIYSAVRAVDLIDTMRRSRIEPKRVRMVHSFAETEASLVLAEGVKGGKSGVKVHAPLVIYERPNEYTMEIRRMLAGSLECAGKR